MHFSYIFINLGFSSRFNFGPRDFKTKVGRNDGYWLSGWAEMNTWDSMYVVFRPTKLGRNHKQFYACFGSKITYLWAFFTSFCWFGSIIQLQQRISAQQMLKSKKFRRAKSCKMIIRTVFWVVNKFLSRFGAGRNHVLRSIKYLKWKFSKMHLLYFGPIRPKTNYFGPSILDSKNTLKMLPGHILQRMNISNIFQCR